MIFIDFTHRFHLRRFSRWGRAALGLEEQAQEQIQQGGLSPAGGPDHRSGATAALDVDTERAVIDAVRQMRGQKTLLMVTHHMSLAEACERVYRLENRRLVRVSR